MLKILVKLKNNVMELWKIEVKVIPTCSGTVLTITDINDLVDLGNFYNDVYLQGMSCTCCDFCDRKEAF